MGGSSSQKWSELLALRLDASGNTTFLRANARRERHQSPLPWDPDLEEASVQPPHMILLDPHFMVYHRRTSQRFDAKR